MIQGAAPPDNPQHDSIQRNIEAERALLSACLLNPRQYVRLRSRIRPSIFGGDLTGRMAQVYERIHAAGMDLTMASLLHEIDRDEDSVRTFRESPEGIALLVALTADGVPSDSAETYLKITEEMAAKRSVLTASEELAALARNGATASDLARALHAYTRRMESLMAAAEAVRTVDVLAALSAQLPPVPWIADGWLGEGDLVIFGGEWASGKSLIALDLAISVAAGVPWMGRVPITKPGPVLYVDEENNARNVTRRLARMIRGRDLEQDQAAALQLRYLTKNHLRLDTPAGLETLRREMEAHRPVLVVLDSLIRFHGADENSNTDIAEFFQAITQLATKYGCAFVVLDHMRKPSKDDERFDTGHRIRGAGDKAGVGDGLWTVEGDRETDSRTFQCRKNRWEDSLPPAMTTSWKVSDDETAAWIECKDAKIAADNSIMSILGRSRGGLLASELYEELAASGVAKRTGIRMVKQLVQSGQIESRKERGRCVRYWVGMLEEVAR